MAKKPVQATISPEERGRRALHVTLRASARVAMETGVELKRLKRAIEDAYVHEALERGWPLKTIGEVLNVSPSKTALLSRQLKKGLMSRMAQDELALERRLEYMLWAKPMTLARLNQVLPQERYSDLSKALKTLVAEERVVRRGDGQSATCEACTCATGPTPGSAPRAATTGSTATACSTRSTSPTPA